MESEWNANTDAHLPLGDAAGVSFTNTNIMDFAAMFGTGPRPTCARLQMKLLVNEEDQLGFSYEQR